MHRHSSFMLWRSHDTGRQQSRTPTYVRTVQYARHFHLLSIQVLIPQLASASLLPSGNMVLKKQDPPADSSSGRSTGSNSQALSSETAHESLQLALMSQLSLADGRGQEQAQPSSTSRPSHPSSDSSDAGMDTGEDSDPEPDNGLADGRQRSAHQTTSTGQGSSRHKPLPTPPEGEELGSSAQKGLPSIPSADLSDSQRADFEARCASSSLSTSVRRSPH